MRVLSFPGIFLEIEGMISIERSFPFLARQSAFIERYGYL
jgi:hypothetical protein